MARLRTCPENRNHYLNSILLRCILIALATDRSMSCRSQDAPWRRGLAGRCDGCGCYIHLETKVCTAFSTAWQSCPLSVRSSGRVPDRPRPSRSVPVPCRPACRRRLYQVRMRSELKRSTQRSPKGLPLSRRILQRTPGFAMAGRCFSRPTRRWLRRAKPSLRDGSRHPTTGWCHRNPRYCRRCR